MKVDKIIEALRWAKVETGSLMCQVCGYEHNCGIHGCAIMSMAADRLANDQTNILALQKEIEKLRNGRRWIPVTEKLPKATDVGDYVLACVTWKNTHLDYQNAVVMAFVSEEGLVDVEMDCVLEGVTHWMPLPEAPEVE